MPKIRGCWCFTCHNLGQLVSFIMACIAVTGHRNYVRFRVKDGLKPNFKMMAAISDIGVPALIEQLVMRVGFYRICKNSSITWNIHVAVHNVCMNIRALSFMNGQAFASFACNFSSWSKLR